MKLDELGLADDAKLFLEEVQRSYPKSNAAKIAKLDEAQRARLVQGIADRGVDFVVQEAVTLSTMPVWHGGRLHGLNASGPAPQTGKNRRRPRRSKAVAGAGGHRYKGASRGEGNIFSHWFGE